MLHVSYEMIMFKEKNGVMKRIKAQQAVQDTLIESQFCSGILQSAMNSRIIIIIMII